MRRRPSVARRSSRRASAPRDVRLDGRERSLDKREAELRTRDKEVAERERRLVAREDDLKKEAVRIAAKDEAIGERESDLLLRQEALRGDAERFERELSDKGRLAEEAVARAEELDRRENELAAREAELNRLQATISHAEREENRGRDLDEWTTRLEDARAVTGPARGRSRQLRVDDHLAEGTRRAPRAACVDAGGAPSRSG